LKDSLSLFAVILLSLLTGCSGISYISHLGWHQGLISYYSIPVQEVLEDGDVPSEVKEKIRFVEEVKGYGEKKLGLTVTKSYSKFFEMKGPVLYVVTACEKDRLRLHHWNFPIIGKVTYKGFFTREKALREKKFLEGRGYDTFVQPVGAYSTLGWLKDPIFSSMLQWNETTLSNVILHEMVHATLYFKGKTSFNEQAATFIGNRGAIDFLTEKYGPASKAVGEAIHFQEDDLRFAQWIDQACRRLVQFYRRQISRAEKLAGREEIFRSLKEEWRGVRGQLKTSLYPGFEDADLNNAVLLAYRRYFYGMERFQALEEYFGGDLKKVVEFLKKLRTSGKEPSSFLDRWIKEKGMDFSGSK
jgi:predicted aminopeptidase